MSLTDGFPAIDDVPEIWIDGVEHVEFEGGGTVRVWLYVRRPGGTSHDVKIALRGSLLGLQDIIKRLALFTADGAIGHPQGTA